MTAVFDIVSHVWDFRHSSHFRWGLLSFLLFCSLCW